MLTLRLSQITCWRFKLLVSQYDVDVRGEGVLVVVSVLMLLQPVFIPSMALLFLTISRSVIAVA